MLTRREACETRRVLTNLVSEPILRKVLRIPNIFWEIRDTLIDIYKFHELGVEVRIAEGPI